jgi:hypothetical protein
MNLSLLESSSMSGPERQAFADRARIAESEVQAAQGARF